jgi:hypothetical protein
MGEQVMEALVAAMILWLSANFGLAATSEQPSVSIVPATEILFRRYDARDPDKQRELLAKTTEIASSYKGRSVVAIYDRSTKTIMLQEGWSGTTAAELSVLLHELVHHLQDASNLRYECPAAREQLAYAAQERWLALFGQSLESQFDIDAFTLKVSTTCGF